MNKFKKIKSLTFRLLQKQENEETLNISIHRSKNSMIATQKKSQKFIIKGNNKKGQYKLNDFLIHLMLIFNEGLSSLLFFSRINDSIIFVTQLNVYFFPLLQLTFSIYQSSLFYMKASQCKHANQQKASSFIGHYHEAPGYMKDNQHITHGYRINFDSPKKILRSLFMLHNESVNIWTHFLPAILLVCLLFYLIVFVGPTNIIHDFEVGRNKLSEGIKSYSEALSNLTFVMKMREIKSETNRQMDEITQSILNSYSNFESGFQNWKSNVEQKLNNFQNEVKGSINQQIVELQTLKQDFQKLFVPYVINGIKDKIDPEYLDSFTSRLEKIKNQIDSQQYSYIQIPSKAGPNPHLVSRWPVFVMLFSAVICLTCSATFHLFYPMSGKSYQFFSRLDYAGINVLISGSSFPALYYGMYCRFQLALFYLTIICIMGLTLFVVSLFEYLHRPQHLTLKSLAYGGFGVSLSIPLAHAVINQVVFNNYGDSFSIKGSIGYYALCGFFYLFGLYVYTVRCPERHRPGRFNVCGNSHQIWHCFVVLGIIATYFGALENLETRKYCVCPTMN